MTVKLAASVAIAACNQIVDAVDTGTPPATCVVYSGPVPANAAAALDPANVALVELSMAEPAFQAAVENAPENCAEASVNTIPDTPAAADGTATFYRQLNGDGEVMWQGTVTEANLGGDMELSSVNVILGVNVVVQSYSLRVPM